MSDVIEDQAAIVQAIKETWIDISDYGSFRTKVLNLLKLDEASFQQQLQGANNSGRYLKHFYRVLDSARGKKQLTDIEKKRLSIIPEEQKHNLELTKFKGTEDDGTATAAYSNIIGKEVLRITYQYRLETLP